MSLYYTLPSNSRTDCEGLTGEVLSKEAGKAPQLCPSTGLSPRTGEEAMNGGPVRSPSDLLPHLLVLDQDGTWQTRAFIQAEHLDRASKGSAVWIGGPLQLCPRKEDIPFWNTGNI